jgi:dipeptidyl aminopeptidase/acylaminoacyl peptidase
MVWAALRGGPDAERLRISGSEAWAPDAAPDGARASFAMKTPGSPWRMSLLEKDGTLRVVLDGLPDVYWVRFDPKGEGLIFDARFRSGSRIGRVKTDGTGLVWLTPEGQDATYPDISMDGELVAYVRTKGQRGEVVVRRLADGSERTLAGDATLPRFSPDGRSLALARSRSYSGGVGVVAVAGGEPSWLTQSGTWPTWLPDGKEIAFADVAPDGSQQAFAVPHSGGPRRPLLARRWQGGHFPFVLDRDGSRLLTTDDSPDRTTIWIAELAGALPR